MKLSKVVKTFNLDDPEYVELRDDFLNAGWCASSQNIKSETETKTIGPKKQSVTFLAQQIPSKKCQKFIRGQWQRKARKSTISLKQRIRLGADLVPKRPHFHTNSQSELATEKQLL